jgi:hypothetical protein
MTFLSNLWQILMKAPQIVGIIKAIMDIVGSAQVQKLLESIRETLTMEIPNPDSPPQTEPERERIIKRLLRRLKGEGDRS